MSGFKNIEQIVSFCHSKGFVYGSSLIYGGLSAIYDYGPLGVELKKRIQNYWWKSMVQHHDNIVGLDSAIFMHPKIWEASGHVAGFNDPMIDDKVSKKRYRADLLIEDYIEKLRKKGLNEKADRVYEALTQAYQTEDLCQALYAIIEQEHILAPDSGAYEWTQVRQFNLMFKTQLKSIAEGEEDTIYLRPETAQGIYVNFKNVLDTTRQSIPFGIAQIGKAFRNEIVARQFIFRMREFEQMEMQYFISPKEDTETFETWVNTRLNWFKSLGINADYLRLETHSPEKLAHYAKAAVDIQYQFPFGWQEIEGIHNRGNYDLTQHSTYTKKNIEYFNPQNREKYIPYIIETSAGVDRCFMALLVDAYCTENVGGEVRHVLKLKNELAPIHIGIFPLTKDDTLKTIATNMANTLRSRYYIQYDEKGSIGRRYRRQDEIGTPFCVTVDFDTIEDHTVTIRHRDSMKQERINQNQLLTYFQDNL